MGILFNLKYFKNFETIFHNTSTYFVQSYVVTRMSERVGSILVK